MPDLAELIGRVSRTPVTTLEELDAMDSEEIIDGYWSGCHGEPEPGDNRSKAFWHGWRNGCTDRRDNRIEPDDAQRLLAHLVVERSKAERKALHSREVGDG